MPDSAPNKVVVIGAGLAGMAVAARLAALGKEVHVYEQSETFGGKAGVMEWKGFVFDTGPSLFTLPDYVDDVFRSCGKNPRDYYSYQKLDTLCHYFWEDGTRLFVPADSDAFAHLVEEKMMDDAETVKKFLRHSRRIHELTEEVFIRNSLHKVKNYLTSRTLKGLLHFSELDTGISMEKAIRRYFKDEKLIQLFMRYATYNGSNPYKAPGTLNVIPHLEFGLGAYMPDKGIREIPEALYQLGLEMGVNYHFNSPVEEIVVDSGKVKGIQVAGEFLESDAVVCNADVWPAYRKLLPKNEAPEKTLQQERSSSAFIFYWAMDSPFEELDVHNIFFSSDYRKEFNSLFEEGKIDDDPTVYVHISSKVCENHAPAGKENWFVMVNAPRHTNQDWEAEAHHLKKSILNKLEKALGKEIKGSILFEATLSPQQIEARTSSYGGSLYGSSSNSKFAAFLRHPNFHSKYKNLYFCGGSVHPGGGIPLVMASAEIVSGLINR